MDKSRYLLAQISDLHIKAGGKLSYRRVDTARMLERCIDALLAAPQRPDAVVATGDLVDFGRADEYAFLRALLARLPMPLYLMPGNHDSRAGLREAFPEHGYLRQAGEGGDPVHYAVDAGPLRLVSFDCTIPGQSGARVDPTQLPWLDRALAGAAGRPTLLLLHHPPFITGIGHMDDIGMHDAAALEAVVAKHAHVERVLCGHLHRHIVRRFGGTLAMTAPSPAHQVTLDLDDAAASRFSMEPPAYLLHWWDPAQGLVTHAAAIGDHGPAWPFFDADGKLID
ncbi:MAG: phosphodiesterase [Candidatus Protistobacter heckmanni]|nr:phosphodiesterase [Candidatus Protistobacter heckmanni]